MPSSACLSLHRACVGRLQVFEYHSRIPTVKCWRMIFRRGVRQYNLVASLLGIMASAARTLASPSRHLHSCQVSARFRPRTMTDSPALHPLHSNRSSPAFRHKIHWLHAWLPLIRFDGRKLARQSGNKSCAPEDKNGRETTSGQQAIARDASHGQDIAIRREAPPIAEDEQ